jgi:hypothetical protein
MTDDGASALRSRLHALVVHNSCVECAECDGWRAECDAWGCGPRACNKIMSTDSQSESVLVAFVTDAACAQTHIARASLAVAAQSLLPAILRPMLAAVPAQARYATAR